MKKVTYALSALAFVCAIVIGAQTARAQSAVTPLPSLTPSEMTQGSMSQSDVLVQMISSHVQHTDLLAESMRKQYSDTADQNASTQALREVSQQISDLIATEFGAQTQEVFNSYWTESMNQFLRYSEGLQNNDESMQNEALVGIHRNIIQASEMIAEETNIPRETVDDVLRQHVNYLRGSIEAYANGDYEQSYTYQLRAQRQIAMIAQIMTDALLQ